MGPGLPEQKDTTARCQIQDSAGTEDQKAYSSLYMAVETEKEPVLMFYITFLWFVGVISMINPSRSLGIWMVAYSYLWCSIFVVVCGCGPNQNRSLAMHVLCASWEGAFLRL